MKGIESSYNFKPNINIVIETASINCSHCAKFQTHPSKIKIYYWEYPSTLVKINIYFASTIFIHVLANCTCTSNVVAITCNDKNY